MRTSTTASVLTAAAVHLAPGVTSLGPVRRAVKLNALSGVGRSDHIALTFDDGPDPTSTPLFLQALDELDVHATFFLLGSMLIRSPSLGRDLVSAGHEVAIHGWDHRPLPSRGPRSTFQDIARATETVRNICELEPLFYRPPYGVMTWASHFAAKRLALTPILWTTWGRDWRRSASRESVHRDVVRHLHPGGTILLHDSDCTSAPRCWRSTLEALPTIIAAARDRGVEVGPLRDHGMRYDGLAS